ncbi:sensor histidine kinase [Aeromicrobium duanguangcaii]|uniref:Histidine kinase n=1 Tax=Aeromicrobium duanguangcaii TaxID=2968086 RepID=A0ABY5KFL5_9ACTN|nr:histidine kinase [Aeromicrobium duanguangcaii]MCD9154292.1 histidine kinase [Aeromicrobium duanguangcaii]MCL3838038.1 histidine kinase [Aeromicrobium duanguangcaii]UUI68640.1 histidine kinase [Aeromicrobium duanguangcaii]
MSPNPDGFVATWRYTATSLWLYVVIGLIGPVARAVSDLAAGIAVVRTVGLLVVIAAVVWFSCRPLIAAAKAGLGQQQFSWGQRARFLAPALLVFPLAWLPPTFPPGVVLVPWLVVSLLAIDLAPRWRNNAVPLVLVLLVGLYALGGWDRLGQLDWSGAYAIGFIAVFLPVVSVFQVWLWQLMLQVRSRGEAEADLAAVRERLRLAADLHDVQGHHLQVIALKAELAERQLDWDPEAARATMNEVQQIARAAIAETKEIVRGYRRTSLREEMANAAAVLEAAGAAVQVDCVGELEQPLFALALREATTNILRHSDATSVRIAASPQRFAITNDGAGPATSSHGTGLASLTERVAAAGGRLAVRREEGHFTLEVTV